MNPRSAEHMESDRIAKALLQPLILQPYRLARRLSDEFIQSDIKSLHRNQSQDMIKQVGEFDSLLDVGSGFGYLGDALQEAKPQAHIVSTDIVNQHKGTSEFRLASGATLPFDSDSFDVVTLCYVLHHMKDPGEALLEASRISRNKIMVQEDAPGNAFERLVSWMHIYTWQSDWPLADIKTRNDVEWQTLFQDKGSVVTSKRRIKLARLPIRRYQYILEKQK